jgi:hypothetical protein
MVGDSYKAQIDPAAPSDIAIGRKRAFGETTMPPARLVARFPQQDIWQSLGPRWI